MTEYNEFGKKVKHALIEKGMTQEALIAQVRERSGMYMDSSTLWKIYTGKLRGKVFKPLICEILDIKE